MAGQRQPGIRGEGHSVLHLLDPDYAARRPIRFGQALISSTGQRAPLYGAAARVNNYLQVIGKKLLPLVSESVVHADEKNPPRGTRALDEGSGKKVCQVDRVTGGFSHVRLRRDQQRRLGVKLAPGAARLFCRGWDRFATSVGSRVGEAWIVAHIRRTRERECLA
ncbi:MAG: hypothetical protein M3397_11585 [Actinomycetota bacterium]|nr:hypothetical protein [Rubrobacter sp.]MDQ3237125.1 hypothetical protein [Actinomycetota bacterium]MDQ3568705.1 hypothetical protein [Actinomycetota bacterium]